jgi:hypothetical protein
MPKDWHRAPSAFRISNFSLVLGCANVVCGGDAVRLCPSAGSCAELARIRENNVSLGGLLVDVSFSNRSLFRCSGP